MRVKNIMTGEIFDIPKHHGDYGMEYTMDFNIILNTSGYLQYDFDRIFAIAGTSAFPTLKNEAKRVAKEQKRIEKDPHYCDYSPYDMPEINQFQYMSADDIKMATRRAEPILQQTEEVKRREQQNQNRSSYEF